MSEENKNKNYTNSSLELIPYVIIQGYLHKYFQLTNSLSAKEINVVDYRKSFSEILNNNFNMAESIIYSIKNTCLSIFARSWTLS